MLRLGTETLKTMSKHGILLKDYVYIDAYEQYRRMRGLGIKYDAAISELSRETNVGIRTLQRAFKRLSMDC